MNKKGVLEIISDEDICDTDEYGRIIINCDNCSKAGEILRVIKEVLSDQWIPCSKAMPEDVLSYNKKATYPAINVLTTLSSGKATKL